MERRAFALWTIGAGLLIGCLGTIFFYNKQVGLSLPLFVLIVVGIVLGSARMARLTPNWRNLWLLIPIVFFAVMVAVRADWSIIVLNVLAIFALGALALHYLAIKEPLDEDTFGQYTRNATVSSIMVGLLPLYMGFQSLDWAREQRPLKSGHASSVGRGLLFTIPLVLVFVVLLASADAVFEDYLNRIWNILQIDGLEDVMNQGMVIAFFGWLGCGALAYGIARHLQQQAETPAAQPHTATPEPAGDAGDDILFAFESDPAPGMPVPAMAGAAAAPAAVRAQAVAASRNGVAAQTASRPKAAKKHPFMLGMIEAVMMLGAVDVLFGVFVLIQFAYFFGGQANISVEGWTYAQYARRGFFELVAVSLLTLGVVLWLDWVTVRHTQRHHTLFRTLAVVMVALTGVMLWSASQRMTLYEEAYGFTHLRVYTHVFMFWLAVLFGVFLLSLFRLRERVFSVGMLAVMIGYLVTLNVMNVEGTIAERNVQRYFYAEVEDDIDICYLRTMSVDALPAILALFQAPDTSEEVRAHAGWWLRDELTRLERQYADTSILSYNWSRATALSQLRALEADLPTRDSTATYDDSFFCGWGSSFTRYD